MHHGELADKQAYAESVAERKVKAARFTTKVLKNEVRAAGIPIEPGDSYANMGTPHAVDSMIATMEALSSENEAENSKQAVDKNLIRIRNDVHDNLGAFQQAAIEDAHAAGKHLDFPPSRH